MVNGIEMGSPRNLNLKEWLDSNGYDPERIAVALNGRVVSKSSMESVALTESDRMEIVSLVGGG